MTRPTLLCAVLARVFAGPAAWAGAPAAHGFSVDFAQCTEFAGVGPVDLTRACSLVQPAFTTLPVGSTAAKRHGRPISRRRAAHRNLFGRT